MTTATPLGQWIDESNMLLARCQMRNWGGALGYLVNRLAHQKKDRAERRLMLFRTIAKAVEGNEEEALQLWTFGEKQPEIPGGTDYDYRNDPQAFLKTIE